MRLCSFYTEGMERRMTMAMLLRPLQVLAVVALLGVALSASAQDAPPRYVPFDIDPNYQKLLEARFKANQQLGPLKDLVRQIMANPDKFPVDPAKFKNMNLDDEKTKKLIQEWVANDPDARKSLRDWLDKNPADGKQPDMKKLQGELKTIVDDGAARKTAPPKNPIGPTGPNDDPLAKLAERALKQTERSKLGEWLRNSPAWKQVFEDLRGSINDAKSPHWKLEGWQARLLDPDGDTWRLGAKSLEHLRNLPTPELERLDWNRSAPDAGEMPDFNFGAPGGFASPALSNAVTWILLIFLCLLVGWQLLHRRKTKTRAETRPNLGPWPVLPEAVATRADLVRAFDYLALWTLGLAVASWNHHAVSRRWSEKSPTCAETAHVLARLYEQARYSPGADILSESERDLARQSLLQIAEAL
jgi:hypothetical protein